MPEYADVPDDVLGHLRAVCGAFPDACEEPAWTGKRWRIRNRTFAHVLTIDGVDGPATVMTFRSSGVELDVLRRSGHPFFRPGHGRENVGMVLGGDTDWTEVAELLTESYCLQAPKKLAALVDRPPADDEDGPDEI